MKTFLCWPSG